jgi:EAL domain-containing protein (putative c-di-GMP-specific phosphodiesterase class I)
VFSRVLKEYEETLSLRDLARRDAGGEPDAASAGPAKLMRQRAVVIDDEEGICKYIASVVGELGYHVDYYTNAQLAFRALRQCAPEVIFLDVALAGADAIDVLRVLERQGYRGVVQLMSGTNQSILEDVRRIGERHNLVMRPPLCKPFRMEAIRKVISELPLAGHPEGKQSPDDGPKVGLEEALERGWLELWYQPKVDLGARTFAGAEGLIRCRHPEHGVLAPQSFMPGAHLNTLVALTQYVIMTALRDWQKLAECGFNLLFAVNTPIAAISDLNLPGLIREHRPASPAWPGLILEVTEGEVAQNIALAHEIATQLSIYGIRFAIDDFGEGYSSFARLRELPFAELKLDASFVQNCSEDARNAAICRAVIELAHSFGAVAVAEGLENAADVQAIRQMGCDLGQGFVLARPMPSELFTSALRARAG